MVFIKINSVLNFSRINTKPTKKIRQLPIVSAPLIAYYIGEYQDKNVNQILTFFETKSIKIPNNLQPDNLTKTGLDPASQTKVKNLLEKALNDKKITQDEFDTYSRKINFTGSPQEVINNPPEALFDPNDPDLMMDPKLEEIYNAPEVNTPEGLLENIFGELPDGFSMDMNLLDTLKGLAKDVFKDVFGDLLG